MTWTEQTAVLHVQQCCGWGHILQTIAAGSRMYPAPSPAMHTEHATI